jgi:hypothetical protein
MPGSPTGADIAARDTGNVNVPGLASLTQTANGCLLKIARPAMFGLASGYALYNYDKTAGTVKVEEFDPAKSITLPFAPSFGSGFGTIPLGTNKLESYTLDLNNNQVLDYQSESGAGVQGKNGFGSHEGWNLGT